MQEKSNISNTSLFYIDLLIKKIDKNQNAQQKVFDRLGHDVEAVISIAFPSFGFADGILPDCRSKLRLLVINLALVPGGQLVNSPTAQSLERCAQQQQTNYSRFLANDSRSIQ
jgi:hypothetical protein